MSTSPPETVSADRERDYELAGRYRLMRLLASGGMSAVWLAEDTRLRRRVAVKVLAAALAHDDRFVERFRREVRIGARLSHPNLVPIFDFGEEPWPYLVTEYVAGGTLAERMVAPAGFDGDRARLAVELLRALSHVHDAGIVHRDVTPANVLFDAGDGRARLTDFGIAHTPRDVRLTQTGMVIGTLAYLAPEVLRGNAATCASDLYSLGVLLCEISRRPAPAALERLTAQLVARLPSARPASARAALALLGARVSDSPHSAIPRPVGGRSPWGEPVGDHLHTATVALRAADLPVADLPVAELPVADLPVARPVPTGATVALPTRGDGTTPMPKRGDGTTPMPKRGDGTTPMPKRGDGTTPMPKRGDGTTPMPKRGDGTTPMPKRGDGTTPMPKRGDGTTPMPAPALEGTVAMPAPTRDGTVAMPMPARGRRRARTVAVLALIALVLAAGTIALRGAQLWGGGHAKRGAAVLTRQLDALERDVRDLTR